MSSLEPWVFNSISLKHLATVKTVEVCWRQSQVGHHVKQFVCDNIFHEPGSPELLLMQLKNRVIPQFECFVDKLIIPHNLKNDLGFYMWQMYSPLLLCMMHTANHMECSVPKLVMEKVFYFIDNMVWNNVGLIDNKKLVESFVSDKESIDYETWVLLCKHCSEDDIRRFADGIDWNKGRFKSNIPIFWYYKIYGTFPTKGMFASPQHYAQFLVHHNEGLYEEPNINATLFRSSISCESLSGVKYFWSKLTDAQKLEQSSEGDIYLAAGSAIAAYMLSQGKFEYLLREDLDVGPWHYLLSWPWILFIDSWTAECRNMPPEKYIAFFGTIVQLKQIMEKHEGIEECSRRLSMGHLHAKYYSPFAKLRSLCEEKFLSDINLIKSLVIVGLQSEDITFCKIVMEGSANWRKMCLDGIVKDMKTYLPRPPNLDFYQQFMEKVLLNDEVKGIFKEVVREVCGYGLHE